MDPYFTSTAAEEPESTIEDRFAEPTSPPDSPPKPVTNPEDDDAETVAPSRCPTSPPMLAAVSPVIVE